METEKELRIKDHIATHPSIAKNALKIYNMMDGRCRQMCMTNPKRPITDYCQKCQVMMREVMG